MRHGEVHNPGRVLYGRLPNFRLSAGGQAMARAAAEYVQGLDRPVTALYSSPLQRTRESSEPFTALFGLEPTLDERIIEPVNVFEGRRMRRALMNPLNWHHLRAPATPSWGEPYVEVVARMDAAMRDAWNAVDSGDVVLVSHQLPIWITHLAVAGQPLRHNPTQRRCSLSSVTSFELDGADGSNGADDPADANSKGRWREVSYATPAATAGAIDVGAV